MEDGRFDLVEQMAFDAETGIVELDRHLLRMMESAETLGFRFDHHLARNDLQAATFRQPSGQIRLLLSRGGAMAIELRPPAGAPAEPVNVALAPLPLDGDDPRLRHCTTHRFEFDGAGGGAFETLFTDAEGFLTQGSFTHLFVPRRGKLLTPPLTRPVANGVLRARLIEQGIAKEAELWPADLKGGFRIGNSLLGLIEAKLAN